jgi:3-methyladenine DNA glycosylase/8-oxoguanine DNA glycosylase
MTRSWRSWGRRKVEPISNFEFRNSNLTSLRLHLPPRFSFDAVVRSHGWYDLPPFEYGRDRGELKTWIDVNALTPALSRRERGEQATLITFRARRGRLEVSSEDLGREELRRIARRVFSLDVELESFARGLAGDPALARALERGSGRMLRAPTLFEDAVKLLLTTNCSWAATRGMVVRLIAEAGAQRRAFPTAERLARLSLARLRKKIRCGYRAQALARLARRVASGRLDLSNWERRERPAEEIRADILTERGFGPYAAEGLLRILGRHDFLALDSWTRQKYRRLHPGPVRSTDRSIARRYARFGPFRGLAMWLELTEDWHSADEGLWP